MIADIAMIVVVLISLYTDIRYRKIYNSVLLPALLLALGYFLCTQGINGLIFSLKGTLLGLSLLLIPFLLGGMGAGDVKLLAVIGAWQGPQFVWFCFLCTAIAGGFFGTFQLFKQGKLLFILKQILFLLIPGTPKLNCFGTLATAKTGEVFPYGVAIATGTFATYFLR